MDVLLWAVTGETGMDTSGFHGEGGRRAITETERPAVGVPLLQACVLPTVRWGWGSGVQSVL